MSNMMDDMMDTNDMVKNTRVYFLGNFLRKDNLMNTVFYQSQSSFSLLQRNKIIMKNNMEVNIWRI